MGKRMLTGLLVALACAAAVEAQAQGVVRVTAERTSVRETPATDAAVVATATKGEELDVLETSGAWFKVRVRSAGREGFVHSLFVERAAAGSATTPSTTPASTSGTATSGGTTATSPRPASTTPSSSSAASQPRGGQPQPGLPPKVQSSIERHMGIGLASGGLGVGFTPSFRLWTDGKIGVEVNASFFDSGGYSVTGISPSVLAKFGEPKQLGSAVSLQPYWGAGISYWHSNVDFLDYYCGVRVDDDCSRSKIGFGGFGGAEFSFDAIPKLAASANLGFYSSALGYGGLYLSIAGHWYFK